jgi:predicted RNA-binding protein
VRTKSGSRCCGCRLLFCDPKDRAALGNLWWVESAGEEKTLRVTARRLDSEDVAHATSQGGKVTRNYWLDLFTGKTWEEFFEHGAQVSGFRPRRRRLAQQIHPGDYLICYLSHLSRFIGVLEVKSECYFDDTAKIWKDEDFPYRFKVEVVYRLAPENAVPIFELKDKLTLFRKSKAKKAWSGFFRGSPGKFDPQDGLLITQAIKEAVNTPTPREYDKKKYWLSPPKTYKSEKVGVVTVPEEQSVDESEVKKVEGPTDTHQQIQWLLLKLGSDMGLDVWVARNDRNREFKGNAFKDIPHLREDLPRQFDEATNRTIELIDVLWLQADAITAAFEVEHTSAIYSGLLRMSDLVSMQPNIRLNLFLVAPDDRRDKVVSEINRPTFAKIKPPLPKLCKFIPYSRLKEEIERIGDKVKYMKPEFLELIAESCEATE